MPQPLVLTGPPGPARDEAFFAQVVEWCTDPHRASRVRYIVPTARRRMEVEDAILRSCPPGKALCGPRVETLDRFARTLFSASEQARLISWRAAAIAIEMLLAAAPRDFPLLLSGRTTAFPGLVQAVLRAIRELKRFAVAPCALVEAARGDAKAREVAQLFRRYEAFLDEQKWADAQDALLVVGERLSADASFCQAELADVAWIVFDGFVEFNPSEMPIVRVLAARFETTFLLDSDPALPELFPPAPPFDGHVEQRACASPLAGIARTAVSDTQARAQTTATRVRLMEADTREQEVERVASAIKALLLDGVSQRDIVLVVPEIGQYAQLVDEIFSAHGLPYSIHHSASVVESPVTTAVLMLLQAAAHDFQRRDLVRLLRSPFVRFEEGGCMLDPGALEGLARGARILRGKRAWLEGLRSRMTYLRRHLDEPDHARDEDESDCVRRAPAAELRALEHLEAPLTSALELLDELRTPRSVSAHAAALRPLIIRFGIEHGATALTWADGRSASHAHALRELLAIVDELELLDRASGQRAAVSLEDFIEVVRASAGAAPLPMSPTLEGIEILDISRAAERRSRILFLAGLVEGSVPRRPAQDALLSAGVRGRAGLPSAEGLAALSQVELYRALTGASESLVLCRPTLEADRPLLKPMMLERIERVLDLAPETPTAPASWGAVLCALGRDDGAYACVEGLLEHPGFTRGPALRAFVHTRGVERARQASAGMPGAYSGQLSEHLLDEIRRVYDREHEFSAGELETYLRCPFRFFAQRVLALAEPAEPEEEITPRDKGTTLHKVFRDFYRQWLDRGHTAVTADNMDEAFEVLSSIAVRRLDELPYQGLIWRKFRERLVGNPRVGPGLLERFLECEASVAGPATCRPRHFEIGFGRQRHREDLDPASSDEPVPLETQDRRILLHGVIDRVDTNDEAKTFSVLDYKSGSDLPTLDEITHGPSIQLPVYVMAAEHLLGHQYRFAAAGYFQTKDAHDCGRKHWLGDATRAKSAGAPRKAATLEPTKVNEWLEREKQLIAATVTGIEQGTFHVTTLGDTQAKCRGCEFKHMCRYDGITMRTFQGWT